MVNQRILSRAPSREESSSPSPEVLSTLQETKIAGEYIILVEGRTDKKRQIDDNVLTEVAVLMKKGLGRKEAVKKTAKAYGLSTKDLYNRSLGKTP